MGLKLITPPAELPVTMAEAKEHLRVDVSDDDTTIDLYVRAATGAAEEWLGRALIDQTWELTLDEFPPNELRIPRPPLIEIVSVIYDDAAGDEQTLNAASYTVDSSSEPGWLTPASGAWPATFAGINAVRIRFRAGYLDNASPAVQNVPDNIRNAILMAAGDYYANRETMIVGQTLTTSTWWEYLLRPFRVQIGMA